MATRVKRETVEAVAAAAAKNLAFKGEYGTPSISKELGVPRRTVRDILADLGPEVEMLKQSLTPEMTVAWHDTFFMAYEEMRQAKNSNDRKNLAITMGISTEKVQLLSGQPTALVANLHEVRVSLPDLVGKLGKVAKIIDAEGAWPSQPR